MLLFMDTYIGASTDMRAERKTVSSASTTRNLTNGAECFLTYANRLVGQILVDYGIEVKDVDGCAA